MASYHAIKHYPPKKKKWIADHLINLRQSLREDIDKNRSPDSLIVASWNIRAFDGGRPRRDESYHYIAEIIDHFDICAIQEVKPDLAPLKRLVELLGKNWSYFVSDVTDGSAGNSERMAFLYNENKVSFRHLIGEIVLPKNSLVDGQAATASNQIARTPFFASFQADWFRFTLCSSHITFAKNEFREQEIATITKILATRAKKEDEVYIFLGDMNIESPDDATMTALTKNGFTAPLFGATNLAGGNHFDQLAFTSENIKTNLQRHGCFDWRSAIYKKDERSHYKKIAEKMRGRPYAKWNEAIYRGWTTWEMSDHMPIWVELKTDYSDDYLKRYI